MKLIIQIPCYNEEETLPVTLAELPRQLKGFDSVEWLVIDDGSSDRTAAVALAGGVDHLVRLPANRGLAAAFLAGLQESLARGADVIVNTDADNQYVAADIPLLTAPVLAGRSGFVIGLRPVYEVKEIPRLIKWLHRAGSIAVMLASGTSVIDPPSGFRAFSREVAGRLRVHNRYTYTLETIIQAGNSGIGIETVPIRIHMARLRPSRLMTSPYSYVCKSAAIILQALLYYNPGRFVRYLTLPLLLAAFSLCHALVYAPTPLSGVLLAVSAGTVLAAILTVLPVIFRQGGYRPGAVCREARP